MPSIKLSNPFRRGADRPSLKERAAALKATAGRVMKRTKPRTSAEAVPAMLPYLPGFAPYPHGAPTQLVAVDLMIRLEAQRLLDAAETEFDRLYEGQSQGLDDAQRDAVAERLRGELRISALAEAAADEDPAPPVDWHNPPAGFMAHPAIEPAAWLKIDAGLRLEAERLHGIALVEFERRRKAFQPTTPGRTEADWSAHLCRRLRLNELTAAAYPEHAEPAGNDRSQPGFVLYEDAGGTTHRRPVADWIGFMAQRLYAVAQSELNRGVNAVCNGLTQEECGKVEAKLRRDLRIDSLHDLAFKSHEIFEASQEYVVGGRWRYGCGDAAGPGLIVAAMLEGWAALSACDGPDETDEEQEAYERAVARRDDLLAAAEALPAIRANLFPKALALAWLEYVALWEKGCSREDYALDGRLALDIHSAAVSLNVDGAAPDAELIALGIELDAAWKREAEADRDCDARADAATAAMPERPACLTFRESDHPFGLIRNSVRSSAMDGLAIEADDIAWMRRGPRKHDVLRDVRPGERAWHDFPGKVLEVVPWPEAQARTDEILTAWDAWQEARRAVDVAHGVGEAEERCSEVSKEISAIWERMAPLPAHTAEGLRVKLRSIRFMVQHTSIGPAPSAVLHSLLRDSGVCEADLTAEA